MIVSYENKELLVLELNFKKDGLCELLCFSDEEKEIEYYNIADVKILDGRLPAEMCISRKRVEKSGGIFGNKIIDTVISLSDRFVDFSDSDLYEREPTACLVFCRYINRIKALHNLPLDDLSELESNIRRKFGEPVSEEERVQQRLSNELDEYLRIGELIEKGEDYNVCLAEDKFQEWKNKFWKSFRMYIQYRNTDFLDHDYTASYWNASYNEEQIKFEDAESDFLHALKVALNENKEEYIFEIMRALSENVITCDRDKYNYKSDAIFDTLMQMPEKFVAEAFYRCENELRTKAPFWYDKLKKELQKSKCWDI